MHPGRGIRRGALTNAQSVAVDGTSHTAFVADSASGSIDVFEAVPLADVSAEAASEVTRTTATLNGNLDPAGGGEITACSFQYVDQAEFEAGRFSAPQSVPCAQSTPITSPAAVTAEIAGLSQETVYHFRLLATDANGTAISSQQTFGTVPAVIVTISAASPLSGTTATLNGHVDAAGGGDITDCHFEYADEASFAANGFAAAASVPCVPGAPITSPTDVSAELAGLTGSSTYHVRLVATDTQGTTRSEDLPFTTLPTPTIAALAATNLTGSEADLTAQINPNGAPTSYRFEYGTTTSYGSSIPVPDATIGAGSSGVAVVQHLADLSANTTYHFRLTAIGANGTVVGGDHTFVYETAGPALPDSRAYEMVTPTQKNGAVIGYLTGAVSWPDLSESGSRVVGASIQCFANSPTCTASRNAEGQPYSFERTPSGWDTSPLALPPSQFGANSLWRVSAEAGSALFYNPSPPGGQDDWVLSRSDGALADLGPVLPPATGPAEPFAENLGEAMVGPADGSKLIWNVASQSQWPFDPTTGGTDVYEYAGTGNSQPLLVGVSGGAGSTDLISSCGTEAGIFGGVSVRPGQVSADGSIVFFMAEACASGSGANSGVPVPANALYARIDNTTSSAHTVAISQRSPGDCTSGPCTSSPPAAANFEGAAADGRIAYFTSTQQLTDDAGEDSTPGDSAAANGCSATTGPNGCNLYLYDFSAPSGHQLIDASAGSAGLGPRVQGVMAISADGTHAYFVARGVLTTAPNSGGDAATDGAENLYLYERDAAHPDGRTVFIASLSEADNAPSSFPFAAGLWTNGPTTANVTPDGDVLVFPSSSTLTADAPSGAGATQLFRYDAGSGELIRISVGNGGFNDNGNASTAGASFVQANLFANRLGPARNDPTMSHDGSRIFFTSPAGLTPGALDDVPVGSQGSLAMNVYEWEQGGRGTCPATRSKGCVLLISDGQDATATSGDSSVRLLGADASGDNVFFRTADQLVPQDPDTIADYYDARVGGGIPYTPPPQPCAGDNCKSPPTTSPTQPSPGTATFSGLGNQLKKHHHHKRDHRKHRHRNHKRQHRAPSGRGGQK